MAIRAEDIDLGRDRALVEAWQAGDGTAFDDLYLRHFDRLRAFCQRRVQNPADAEEIAQEAFVRALQALPRLDGERRFYPWVSVIAHRLCMDHHRRLARVRPSDAVDPGSVDDDTTGRLALQADIEHLDQALRRLGPRHAEVLELRERRGMSYHEIADQLAVPHSTVETLLFRARKALKREFAAVSGERLAGFPLVGWLALRLGRLRERVGDAPAILASPIAAGAMAAVVGLTGPAPSPEPTPVTTIARPPAVSAPLSPVTTSVDAVDAPVPPAADTEPPSSGSTSDRAGLGGTLGAAGVERAGADGAREASHEMPVHTDVGPITVGFDPHEIVSSIEERMPTGGNP